VSKLIDDFIGYLIITIIICLFDCKLLHSVIILKIHDILLSMSISRCHWTHLMTV